MNPSPNYTSNLTRTIQETSSEAGMSFMQLITQVLEHGENGNPSDYELVQMVKEYFKETV